MLLLGCSGYKDCDNVKAFGPGNWEKGGTRTDEENEYHVLKF